jgi:hypothetical protein
MRITVLAHRFANGSWKSWEHVCDEAEVAAVLDSAKAKAFERSFSSELADADYLAGARYVFNRAFGTTERFAEGDLRVMKIDVSIVAQTLDDGVADPLIHKLTA